MTTQDFMWLAIGLAALIIAGGLLYVFVRVGLLLTQAQATLAKADAKLDQFDVPVMKTMDHIGNIADSVDSMVARVDRVTAVAERAAGAVDKATDAASASIAPTVAKIASLIAGVSAGARSFLTRRGKDNGKDNGSN
ncbi:MAG: hypothetical protein JO293_08230 [Candidatus Eremiobacteraeota bacterium]|nr:hypothetical protein [Candidatus Eremiobacteraeota bacterium]